MKRIIKPFLCFLLAALFIFTGTLHFMRPNFYMKIMPPYLPYHLELVYISGFFEILGGIGVLIAQVRRWAGYGLMALLLAVFPANVHMAINSVTIDVAGVATSPALLWLRLPLQAVLIAWVWWCTRDESDIAHDSQLDTRSHGSG